MVGMTRGLAVRLWNCENETWIRCDRMVVMTRGLAVMIRNGGNEV